MNTLKFSTLFSILFMGTVIFSGANASLIVNGSFEDGTYSPVSSSSWVTVSNGQTNITGWTIGGQAVDWHNGTEFNPIQDGLRAVDLNLSGGGLTDTGTLSQSFATDVNAWYSLDFWFAGPKTDFPDPRQVQVGIAGLTTIFDQPASPNFTLDWGLHTLDFQAIATTTTLQFSAVNGSGYWGALIDNVSVNKVPEPSILALMGLGILGLGLSRRKIKK